MIVVIDVESTGKDRAKDQIVEICIQDGLHSYDLEDGIKAGVSHVWRIKPSVPIHPEAEKVHGITAESLASCPSFADVAPAILAIITAAEVIVGYNVAFDLDMLQAEIARAGIKPLDLSTKHVVDVLRLWHHVEPRTLAAAHEKFLGSPLENAHAAGADVPATARVLEAMLAKFGLADRAWPEIAAIANPFEGRENWIGPSHHVQWSDAGPVFMFGKNKGVRVDETDTGFLQWVVDKDFPRHVKHICRAAMKFRGLQLEMWIANQYPRALKEAG